MSEFENEIRLQTYRNEAGEVTHWEIVQGWASQRRVLERLPVTALCPPRATRAHA